MGMQEYNEECSTSANQLNTGTVYKEEIEASSTGSAIDFPVLSSRQTKGEARKTPWVGAAVGKWNGGMDEAI